MWVLQVEKSNKDVSLLIFMIFNPLVLGVTDMLGAPGQTQGLIALMMAVCLLDCYR